VLSHDIIVADKHYRRAKSTWLLPIKQLGVRVISLNQMLIFINKYQALMRAMVGN